MILFIAPTKLHSSSKLKLGAFIKVFDNLKFRTAAYGYFGHMWELYAFWAFLPIILNIYLKLHPQTYLNVHFISFIVIAIGSVGCIVGGYISQILGVKRTAFIALLSSAVCCLMLPFIFYLNSEAVLISFLLFWGIMVVADSPLFSTMVAQNSLSELKGTALTIVNCIGFTITIISIQLLSYLSLKFNSPFIYMILALGPIIGLVALKRESDKLN